ncbi:MAG: hypothetical protein L6R41_004080 [Letrouitia leprolyta]|nr:MAG: hypothetical protein L6R41_004080 [Letrouitia leprolyta]
MEVEGQSGHGRMDDDKPCPAAKARHSVDKDTVDNPTKDPSKPIALPSSRSHLKKHSQHLRERAELRENYLKLVNLYPSAVTSSAAVRPSRFKTIHKSKVYKPPPPGSAIPPYLMTPAPSLLVTPPSGDEAEPFEPTHAWSPMKLPTLDDERYPDHHDLRTSKKNLEKI